MKRTTAKTGGMICGMLEFRAKETRVRLEETKKIKHRLRRAGAGLLAAVLTVCLIGCAAKAPAERETAAPQASASVMDLSALPAFCGEPYVTVNGNVPEFTEEDLAASSFETYAELDSLGRCGVAFANIGTDLMSTEERGAIGQVKPSGWHTVKYDFVDGRYLYNRCHLIAYQLTAENANVRNLITGTRYLNVEGMMPFENMTADYIRETGNHVLYRVTPVFDGDNLIASGVQMEAESVEDQGDGIQFNVYCYNVQPGVRIDYATGDSELDDAQASGTQQNQTPVAGSMESVPTDDRETVYILNTNTHKFHDPSCPSANKISEKNRQEFNGTRDDVLSMGYAPCHECRP